MTDQNIPAPDPGNAPPEEWTAPMSDEERAEFDQARHEHRADVDAEGKVDKDAAVAKAQAAGADFVVVDGNVVQVPDETVTSSSLGRGEAAYQEQVNEGGAVKDETPAAPIEVESPAAPVEENPGGESE
jgi:hypothetical protein